MHDPIGSRCVRVRQVTDALSDAADKQALPAGDGGLGSVKAYEIPEELRWAGEQAVLDWFHRTVPIGCLEEFECEVDPRERLEEAAFMLSGEVSRLRAAVRKHRDYRGDDRCFQDDAELYAVLPEGDTRPAVDTAVTLENCQKYIACRQAGRVYVSPERELEWARGAIERLLMQVEACGQKFFDYAAAHQAKTPLLLGGAAALSARKASDNMTLYLGCHELAATIRLEQAAHVP